MESPEPLLQFFRFEHLPPNLQTASRPFCVLAIQMVKQLPRNPERTVMLRKLLESKDAAVRTLLYEPAAAEPTAEPTAGELQNNEMPMDRRTRGRIVDLPTMPPLVPAGSKD